MPKNPKGLIFLQKNKRPHITLGMAVKEPGKWGRLTIARQHGWNIYVFKKTIDKLIKKGLVVVKLNKLWPTELGSKVYNETPQNPDYLKTQ